jgi:hypothetical protein
LTARLFDLEGLALATRQRKVESILLQISIVSYILKEQLGMFAKLLLRVLLLYNLKVVAYAKRVTCTYIF